MTKQPTIIKADSWEDYKKITGGLSLERTSFINYYKGIEHVFLTEFKRGARNYLTRDELPEHTIEWLALMQHHGAPTRLVDFSKSPFISAYFAFEQCNAEVEKVAIWAININVIRTAAYNIIREKFGEEAGKNKRYINETVFEKIFELDELSLIFPVEPFKMNRRYSIQQSIFVSTGNSKQPFMEQVDFLGDDISKVMIRIEIPTLDKKAVIRDLMKMNINRASLFPDLDGYALSLKMKYENMRSAEEALEHQVRLVNDPSYRFYP